VRSAVACSGRTSGFGQFETFDMLRESSTIVPRRTARIVDWNDIREVQANADFLGKCRPATSQNVRPATTPATPNTGATE
jgi:hypothetical protein